MQIVPVGISGCEVKPAIRPKSQAVEAAIIRMTKSGQNNSALVCASIAISIFERYKVGRIGQVQLALLPYKAHGWGELISKYSRRFIPTITIPVFQQADATLSNLLLKLLVEIIA